MTENLNRHIIRFMKSTVRLNAKLFPVIAFLAFVMQILDPSRVWIILIIGIGGSWLVCWWWARGLQRSLIFEREMRYGWARVGDRLEERFTLSNTFVLPATWITLNDHSTLPNHYASVATGVDGSSTSQWKINTQCTRRGVYTLGGTTLETGDPLGMYTVTFEDPTSSTLAVMPPVVTLPKFNILSSGWAGEGKTNPRSLEETINASHTREMTPNDPMRWIHWKSTARHNKYFVRQFEGTPAGDWWILLDLNQSIQLGTGWDSTEEHSVIFAASVAAQSLDQEHPVGLAINGYEPTWLVPRRNEAQQRSLLKALAITAPTAMALQDYLPRIGQALGSHSSLLIVTADTDPAWTESLMPLTWRGILPTVFLLDPITFGGTNDTKPIADVLQMMSIPCHIIPKELLDTKQIKPGQEGEWDWRISATGKAIAVRNPLVDWRRLE
jgi:uncharacterized protein (DUF58 family)